MMEFLDHTIVTYEQKMTLLDNYNSKVKNSDMYLEEIRIGHEKFALKIWESMFSMIRTKFMA